MMPSTYRAVSLPLLLLLCFAVGPTVGAPFRLHNLFSHDMVLQRAPQRAVVWGLGEPGSLITAAVDGGDHVSASVDSSGQWRMQLLAHGISFNSSLQVTDGVHSTLLTGVAFGDVYLCSGQSNMQVTLNFSFGGADAIAQYAQYPNIRLNNIPSQTSTTGPLYEGQLSYTPNSWVRPSVASLAADPADIVNYFSAVCWYAGRDVYDALKGSVPIGLVQGSVGGTLATAWTSPDSNERCGPIVVEPGFNQSYNQPSALYYSMIHPLLPMRFAAVLWYQAESDILHPDRYLCGFPNMIQDWRTHFASPDLPFYFVLIASYTSNGQLLPPIRQAQLSGLSLPHTAVASALDLGDEYGPIGDVHPRNKSYVGGRLARIALRRLYGQDVVDSGPVLLSTQWARVGGGGVQLSFQYDDTQASAGLMAMGTPNCTQVSVCCEVRKDGAVLNLLDVQAMMPGGGLINVSAPAVIIDPVQRLLLATLSCTPAAPMGTVLQISFGYAPYPGCLLYNAALLPALPSRLYLTLTNAPQASAHAPMTLAEA